jgi:hypothetical protein
LAASAYPVHDLEHLFGAHDLEKASHRRGGIYEPQDAMSTAGAIDALLSEQLYEHRAGQRVALGPGGQTVNGTSRQWSLRGEVRVRVGSGRGGRTRAQVLHDIAQALLDESALSVIQEFPAVIDLDCGDNGDEHGIVKRGQGVCLEVGL